MFLSNPVIASIECSRRGKRAIAGGRRVLRHVIFQAALVASLQNPTMKAFADSLRKAGKPHKVIITAVARKLVTLVKALCKSRPKWGPFGSLTDTVAKQSAMLPLTRKSQAYGCN
jgi:hypothetical protein